METSNNDTYTDDSTEFELPKRLDYSRVRWRLLSDILEEGDR